MLEAVRDVAEGSISVENLTAALNKAVTKKTLRLADQGTFYNPPEEPSIIELDMKAFNRSARAIAKNRERIAALMRNAKPLPQHRISTLVCQVAVLWRTQFLPLQLLSPSCSAPHLPFLL